MLEEAIEVMRLLWQGGEQTHRGKHYTVDHARLYTLPESPPPIAVAAAKPKAAALAGGSATPSSTRRPTPSSSRRTAPPAARGRATGWCALCWARGRGAGEGDRPQALALHALGGSIGQELARPSDFDAVAESVTLEQAAEGTPCGPDPEPVLELVRTWEQAGFDHIALHQVGPDQEGFFRFWEDELRRRLNG